MERKFVEAWLSCRAQAQAQGVRFRPMKPEEAMQTAHRSLTGSRESDGFSQLCQKKLIKLSLEALAVDRRFTALFSDTEADNALQRLMDAGYFG